MYTYISLSSPYLGYVYKANKIIDEVCGFLNSGKEVDA